MADNLEPVRRCHLVAGLTTYFAGRDKPATPNNGDFNWILDFMAAEGFTSETRKVGPKGKTVARWIYRTTKGSVDQIVALVVQAASARMSKIKNHTRRVAQTSPSHTGARVSAPEGADQDHQVTDTVHEGQDPTQLGVGVLVETTTTKPESIDPKITPRDTQEAEKADTGSTDHQIKTPRRPRGSSRVRAALSLARARCQRVLRRRQHHQATDVPEEQPTPAPAPRKLTLTEMRDVDPWGIDSANQAQEPTPTSTTSGRAQEGPR
ncbi:hypothetical protein [Geodermatophilus sp. Leaf369]|uniref:hypothetical protein n=1 Tax=Geodermatophilus sp. Leaf369 TaxID=1736354 RepID=UPI0012F95DF3|nr:hypothetical protein [Geodermatophilus sp. Leaf369]